ncbi:MAG: hypothetical protein JNM31_08675 [Flavobacteriales bacterium]|nr:hypothetical protein [Flavobacteriales bacterium]
MMRAWTTLLIGAGLSIPSGIAQDTVTIKGRYTDMATDEFGHLYALQGDVLELYDPMGRLVIRNSVKTFGPISLIDAFYSLKPMLFSIEQGQLAMLDNTLSLQASVVNLPRNGYPQVTLACAGVQNCLWFFDQRDMAVMRVDAQLRELAHTGRLDQLLGISPEPVFMLEHDSQLFMNDPANGILVFDLFGAYMRTLPIKGITRFEVRNGRVYYLSGGAFHEYDMRSFATRDIPMAPHGEVLDARIERGRLYLRRPADIRIVPLPTGP